MVEIIYAEIYGKRSKSCTCTNNNTCCCMCNVRIHLKCTGGDAITVIGKLYCEICVNIHDPKKYNPFYETLKSISSENDYNHFDNEPTESLDILESLSSTLESCKAYSIQEFNKYISLPKTRITGDSKHYLLPLPKYRWKRHKL